MSQLIFKFPFKAVYDEKDYYVSNNNFLSYRLIENWPNWPDRWVNIFGPPRCGKTHLSNILKKKIYSAEIINAENVNSETFKKLDKLNCIIIDNYNNNINEEVLYSILNQSKQFNKFIVINSNIPIKDMSYSLKDMKSRANSFVNLGIDLPTDDLLRVIISKYFSDKQIDVNPRVSEYIIKNIERSYDKVFKFIKEVDNLSLSSGKSININLIKKVLNE